MIRWLKLDGQTPEWDACVVAIGVFDGVHRGHRLTVERCVAAARERGVPAVVLTFDPHPAGVVRPNGAPLLLTNVVRRAQLLGDVGVDALAVLRFDRDLSELSPEQFVEQVLVARLHAVHVVVGDNFRFGHKASGDVGTLTELGERYGFTVDDVPLGRVDGGADEVVSSSWIRARVADGDVAAAARGLGRPHEVSGPVVRGDRRGRELGYPTANLEVADTAAVPADGVYAGRLVRADGERLPAAISVGTNPTFDGTHRRVEGYVLDADIDLYGEHVTLEFVERLRGQERFDSVDALVEQMGHDVAQTREILGAPTPGGSLR